MTARVVLVVGPPLAGVSEVAAALRDRLVDVVVLEGASDRPPDAVVGVLSAVAPAVRSDWAPVEHAAAGTALVVGAVAKIDAHRGWRDVLEADRTSVTGWDARRIPWVGVAAAPGLGEPCVGELVELLRDRLADPGLDQRNRLLQANFRVRSMAVRPAGREVVDMRGARLRLLRVVRDRSAQWRTDLREAAAGVPFGGAADFEARVRAQAERFLADLADEITGATGVDASAGMSPAVDRLPSARALEGRLMAVLGAGFGLGIALACSRILGGLAPGLAVPGLLLGATAGLTLMTWVVRVRRLLHDRALLDRWVTEVVSTLRWHGEAMVAERLLLAESERPVSDARPPAGTRYRALEEVTDQYLW
jgi:hypothetical protein